MIRKPLTENKNPIFKKLNYYGVKSVNNNDTTFIEIEKFTALTQEGQSFGNDILGQRYCIVSFINYDDMFATPRVLAQLYTAQEKMKHLKKLSILSLNTNPNPKGVQQMLLLANKVHAQKHKWFFLELQNQNFDAFANKNFWVFGNKVKFDANELMHTLFLMDKQMHLRGIYDATYVEDVKRLVDECSVLDAEYRFEENRK